MQKFKYIIWKQNVDDTWEEDSFTIKKGTPSNKCLRRLALKSMDNLSPTKALCALVFASKDGGFVPISLAYKNPYEKGILLEGCLSKKTYKELDIDTLQDILRREIRCHLEKEDRKVLGRNFDPEGQNSRG